MELNVKGCAKASKRPREHIYFCAESAHDDQAAIEILDQDTFAGRGVLDFRNQGDVLAPLQRPGKRPRRFSIIGRRDEIRLRHPPPASGESEGRIFNRTSQASRVRA